MQHRVRIKNVFIGLKQICLKFNVRAAFVGNEDGMDIIVILTILEKLEDLTMLLG